MVLVAADIAPHGPAAKEAGNARADRAAFTAHRLARQERAGPMITREPNLKDKRRSLIALTDTALSCPPAARDRPACA